MENKKFNFVLLGYNRATIEWAPSINAYAVEDFKCDGVEEFSLEEARVDEILGERAYSGGDIPETLIDEVQAATIDQDSITYKYFFYEGDFEKHSAEFVFLLKKTTQSFLYIRPKEILKIGMQNGKNSIIQFMFQTI